MNVEHKVHKIVIGVALGLAIEARYLAAMIATKDLIDGGGGFGEMIEFRARIGDAHLLFVHRQARPPHVINDVAQKFVRIFLPPKRKMPGDRLQAMSNVVRAKDVAHLAIECRIDVMVQQANHTKIEMTLCGVVVDV